jgi:hypothetical protein
VALEDEHVRGEGPPITTAAYEQEVSLNASWIATLVSGLVEADLQWPLIW